MADDDREPGEEPDPRFTFANERTFLAWQRTALALIGGGIAVTQILPPFELPGGRRLLGLPMIAIGGLIAFTSYGRWAANQRALRLGEPLPEHWLNRALGIVIGLGALLAAVLAVVGPK
jgi:putative membrane protein